VAAAISICPVQRCVPNVAAGMVIVPRSSSCQSEVLIGNTHALWFIGPSSAFHDSRNELLNDPDWTRAFTRNTPTCDRFPVPAIAVVVPATSVRLTELLPDAFGSYAPVVVACAPENPVVTMSSESTSSDVDALYVSGPSSPHSTCRRDWVALSVTISSPSASMSPGMLASSSTWNGVLVVAVEPYTTRAPTPYGWQVNSMLITGRCCIHIRPSSARLIGRPVISPVRTVNVTDKEALPGVQTSGTPAVVLDALRSLSTIVPTCPSAAFIDDCGDTSSFSVIVRFSCSGCRNSAALSVSAAVIQFCRSRGGSAVSSRSVKFPPLRMMPSRTQDSAAISTRAPRRCQE
jgi:hypothetical protein